MITKDNFMDLRWEDIDWNSLHGPVAIPMTNDYLFRALLQRNNRVLKALICSLLHLDMEDVQSVIITNPIELGESITDKEFILDIKIELNQNTIINLEMQVVNEGDWEERSLCYLCRSFDNLNRGDNYASVKAAVHIGILDFTLFEEYPEFYANYWMINERNYNRYSDKLRLSVLDLNCINLATEEDKKYKIDYWAKLFKSTTWEELKMYAESNEYLREATTSIYKLTQDEKIRQQCEAREDYRRRTVGRERLLKEAQDNVKRQQIKLEEQQSKLEEQQSKLEEQRSILNKQQGMIEWAVEMFVHTCKEHGESRENVAYKLSEGYDLPQEKIELYMKKFWDK